MSTKIHILFRSETYSFCKDTLRATILVTTPKRGCGLLQREAAGDGHGVRSDAAGRGGGGREGSGGARAHRHPREQRRGPSRSAKFVKLVVDCNEVVKLKGAIGPVL